MEGNRPSHKQPPAETGNEPELHRVMSSTANRPSSPGSRPEAFAHHGFRGADPFAPRQRPGASFVHAILATALFRCWHILIFFSGWAILITVLNHQHHGKLSVAPTLLTVIGTVLGFIISYRTTSSFERYNEGRRLWSQIILANRTFARTVWFHVPDTPPGEPLTQERRARSLVEKKTVINLLEAYAVAVKHYLRGEDGIYYRDLYYLVKFLPAYQLPAGMPSAADLLQSEAELNSKASFESDLQYGNDLSSEGPRPSFATQASGLHHRNTPSSPAILPQHVNDVSPNTPRGLTINPDEGKHVGFSNLMSPRYIPSRRSVYEKDRFILNKTEEESDLLPAYMPPKYSYFDLFPFSLLVKFLTEKGKDVRGKKAAKWRARLRNQAVSHNLPLEISLYISSYVAKIQHDKFCDVPTNNNLIMSLNQLVDSLTGLERILTTPIPFSYAIHLWVVTILYCLAMPLQIWASMKWWTIPATILSSFIFFGFLVAGEEIENPFGYDKNDLNLDHFTHNIIRNELKAITSTPPPDPADWAFVPENNLLFSDSIEERMSPNEWLSKGAAAMQASLSRF